MIRIKMQDFVNNYFAINDGSILTIAVIKISFIDEVPENDFFDIKMVQYFSCIYFYNKSKRTTDFFTICTGRHIIKDPISEYYTMEKEGCLIKLRGNKVKNISNHILKTKEFKQLLREAYGFDRYKYTVNPPLLDLGDCQDFAYNDCDYKFYSKAVHISILNS